MGLFGRGQSQGRQDGLTAETAILLPAVGTASAIAAEHLILEKLFGREGSDWRIHDRIRSTGATGRELEMFILGTRDGRRVMYFDITDALNSHNSTAAQEIVDTAMTRQKNRALTITLPKGAFLMLYKIIDDVGYQVANKDLDPESVRKAVMHSLSEHDLNTKEEFSLTLSVLDWVNILSVTKLIDVPSLTAEELVNDLRAYIEGALKKAGPG